MQQAAEDIATALALDAFGGDAHALLMAIYKDEKRPIELRLEAAKAAIGYEKPRLATVEAKFDGTIEYYTAQPIPVEQRETDRLYQQTTGE